MGFIPRMARILFVYFHRGVCASGCLYHPTSRDVWLWRKLWQPAGQQNGLPRGNLNSGRCFYYLPVVFHWHNNRWGLAILVSIHLGDFVKPPVAAGMCDLCGGELLRAGLVSVCQILMLTTLSYQPRSLTIPKVGQTSPSVGRPASDLAACARFFSFRSRDGCSARHNTYAGKKCRPYWEY